MLDRKPTLNLQNHYTIELNTNKDLYKYSSCQTENVPLFGHQELPQGYTFIQPKLSRNEKYLSAIARGSNNDYVYIWDTSNLDSYLYRYVGDKIDGVEFAPNNLSFVIIFKENPPVHYNIKSGHEIIIFKPTEQKQTQTLSYTFSEKSRFFGLATLDHFTIWDTLTGKVKINIKNESPEKIIRDEILISVQKDCIIEIIKFMENKTEKKFQLNLQNYNEILASMISPDLKYFFYATNKSIFKLNIENANVEEIIKFNGTMEKVEISNDCNNCVSTDLKILYFYQLDSRKLIGKIYKEKFHSFTINFEKSKLCLASEICINIVDYSKEDDEQFIWLNLNPERFQSFKFSPDFSVLLAKVDDNNALLYNCMNGRIIRKWCNHARKWSIACEMVPETSEIAVVATKSDEDCVKVWNYIKGVELMTLEGFNAHSLFFNSSGQLLGCGAEEGMEIARVWDLTSSEKKFYNSYTYKGENNNKGTRIYITRNEPSLLICCSEKQVPVVYYIENREMKFECEKADFDFDEIEDIQSSLDDKILFVKGKTNGTINAILYNLEDGKIIKIYEKCNNIDFGRNLLLSRSKNENNGKLLITDFKNNKTVSCELDAEVSNFIQDNKVIVSAFGKEKEINFILSDVNTGNMMAEIKYKQKVDNHAEIDVSANEEQNILIFRYLELVNPARINN